MTQIGGAIDNLGVRAGLREGDLLTDVVVLMKVVEPDGNVRLSTCWSEGMSWIERLGMLRAAEQCDLPRNDPSATVDDEEE